MYISSTVKIRIESSLSFKKLFSAIDFNEIKAGRVWVKRFYDCHFKIEDLEKIFVETSNDQIKQIIVIGVKGVIYFRNVKRYLLKI